MVLLSSAAICALLCMLRNLSALKYAAAAAVLAVGFTVAMLIRQALLYPCEHGDCIDECGRPGWCDANSTTSSATGVYAAPPSVASVFQALPLIAFALQCHIQSALCWSELPPRLQGDAATRKIGLGAVVLVLVLYIPTGIAGFARFGGATQGDILNNFGTADGLADIARVCIAVTALSAFPSQHFPARVALWRWYKELRLPPPPGGRDSRLYLNTGDVQPSPSTMTRNAQLSNVSEILDDDLLAAAAEEDAGAPLGFIVVESVVWVAVVAVVAQALGSALSQVFALIGAICGGTVIFLVPGLLWANLGAARPRRRSGSCRRPLDRGRALHHVRGHRRHAQQMVRRASAAATARAPPTPTTAAVRVSGRVSFKARLLQICRVSRYTSASLPTPIVPRAPRSHDRTEARALVLVPSGAPSAAPRRLELVRSASLLLRRLQRREILRVLRLACSCTLWV